MTRLTQRLCASAALVALATLSSAAYADGRNYNDGPVVNVSFVRTVDGHFDDYMQWLATTWKKQEEAAKKAGLILSYEVDVAQPQSPNDADVILIVRFKNWAALDGLGSKLDAVTAQIEGSLEKANQAQAGRAKIRTILGSTTVQVAELK
ncbi:MAG TPA: hypothetical protein VEC10_03620 [Steroidobacteraceae bacterium]|nr:hypothetical protein [Steroidobacteraceae bacterium]